MNSATSLSGQLYCFTSCLNGAGGKFNIVGAFLTLIVVLYLSYLIVVPVLFPSINMNRMHRALKPVLRSSWLKIHVSASAFGYAGFTLAFTAAVMWLLRSRLPEKKYPARIMRTSTVEECIARQ